MIPNNWKTRLGYRDQLLKFIGDDGNFCNYLVKNNGSKNLDSFGCKGNNTDNQNKDLKGKSSKKNIEEINSNNTSDFYKQNNNLNKDPNESGNNSRKHQTSNVTPMDVNNTFNDNNYNETPIKTTNNQNLMQINESRKQEEEDDKFHKRKSSVLKNYSSPKRFNNSTSSITEKEKRTILEHYRNLYSFKKTSNNKLSPINNKANDKKFPFFPVISGRPLCRPHRVPSPTAAYCAFFEEVDEG